METGGNQMTVKMDRYVTSSTDRHLSIIDRAAFYHTEVVMIATGNHELDKVLIDLCLDEMNTGKWEVKENAR